MSAPVPRRSRLVERLAERLSPAAGRTPGEWAVDAVLFAVAILAAFAAVAPGANPQLPTEWRPWDIALGVVATASIWWTRRYPLAVGLLLVIPGAAALTAMVGVLVAVYRMGLLAHVRPALLITAFHVALALPYHAVLPLPGMAWTVWLVVIPLLYALSLCIGLLGRARRQLIIGLREAAARDRERYEERLASVQRDERVRIAREMHDVLAHRISLLSMHAGALEYRAGSAVPLEAAETRAAAGVIRESAEAAVDDLRELLGLLRSDEALGAAAPQPRLADVERLLRDASTAGQRIDVVADTRPDRLRESTQRTAYRIVQEALTNARKHAPEAPVRLRMAQDAERLSILVTNPVPPGLTERDLSSRGNGLLGLEERVRIDGGRIRTGIEDGEFRVQVELPARTP